MEYEEQDKDPIFQQSLKNHYDKSKRSSKIAETKKKLSFI